MERGEEGVEVNPHRYPSRMHTSPFITPCYRCDDRESGRRQSGGKRECRGGGGRWEEEGGIDEGS